LIMHIDCVESYQWWYFHGPSQHSSTVSRPTASGFGWWRWLHWHSVACGLCWQPAQPLVRVVWVPGSWTKCQHSLPVPLVGKRHKVSLGCFLTVHLYEACCPMAISHPGCDLPILPMYTTLRSDYASYPLGYSPSVSRAAWAQSTLMHSPAGGELQQGHQAGACLFCQTSRLFRQSGSDVAWCSHCPRMLSSIQDTCDIITFLFSNNTFLPQNRIPLAPPIHVQHSPTLGYSYRYCLLYAPY
jgi:hypothetical protein